MMEELLPVAGGLAASTVFKKMALDLYTYVSSKTGKKITQLSVEAQVNNLHKRASQFRKVKTIWQFDKAVDLKEFYCDSHVSINKRRKKIRYLNDFGTEENVLVQGIAGQGKSIFLRYLCSMELSRGKCIPLFLELRKVSKVQPLKDRICIAFKSLGINVDDQLFNTLLESGKILLLLDAFDEVPEDLKSEVLTDIEDLASAYPALRIIITSRPHQSIRASSHFLIVQLDNLRGDEYKTVIKKMSHDSHLASNLITHIEKREKHMREMLCTPPHDIAASIVL